MKFSIFYFSGTGNTKWVIDEFNNSIIKRGHEGNFYSIETRITNPKETNLKKAAEANLRKILNESDLIGFAFPIYGANMPNIMISFIESFKSILLKLNDKKPAFIITTAGYIDAFGPIAANKILKRNGFRLVGYMNALMSNNISTPKLKASFQTSEIMKIRMEKGKEEIEKLINAITAQKSYIGNIGFYLIPGIVIRRVTKKAQKKNYMVLSIDKEKCSKCMMCINNCPTKSIIFTDDKFNFLPSCTACMRCYNFCPSYAVYHEGKYADPDNYNRYRGPQSIL